VPMPTYMVLVLSDGELRVGERQVPYPCPLASRTPGRGTTRSGQAPPFPGPGGAA